MSQFKSFGSIDTKRITFTNKGAVTQATSLTSGVTLNSPVGSISTISTSLATSGNLAFVCTNACVKAGDYVFANIIDYAGSNGTPSVIVDNITRGSFAINVRNSHPTAPLNGAVKIGFFIV
jgi:hypothetical protein